MAVRQHNLTLNIPSDEVRIRTNINGKTIEHKTITTYNIATRETFGLKSEPNKCLTILFNVLPQMKIKKKEKAHSIC